MRKFLTGTAAMLAIAVPGIAAAQTGYIGANYNTIDAGKTPGSDVDTYGIEGAVFIPAGGLGIEVDASIDDGDKVDTAYNVAGHFFTRNDSFLLGGLVAVSQSDDSTAYVVGAEANKFFERSTLSASLVYGTNDDDDVDGYGLDVGYSAFATDNIRLTAHGIWVTLDDGTTSDDALGYGVGAEWQLSSVPVSFAVNYDHVDFDVNEVDAVGFSIRYNFGGTLLERDRSGASQADRGVLASLF